MTLRRQKPLGQPALGYLGPSPARRRSIAAKRETQPWDEMDEADTRDVERGSPQSIASRKALQARQYRKRARPVAHDSQRRSTGASSRKQSRSRVYEICAAQSSHLRPITRVLEQRGWSRSAHRRGPNGGGGLPSALSLRACSLLLTVDNLPSSALLARNKHLFHNHFERNTEITTKQALAHNLENLHWNYGVSAKHLFPRCYTLHDAAGKKSFREDYRQTAAASVLRSVVELGDDALRLAKIPLLRMALLVCDERVGHYLGQVTRAHAFSDAQWDELTALSQELAGLEDCSPSTTQRLASRDAGLGALVAKARQLLGQLGRLDPQWAMNGRRNIWIVKPGDKSRGAGIYIHNDLRHLEANGTRMSGARIVQKYVENPQLGPGSRKLDLRVWVLVTAWDPLEAWIYTPFYCRVCRDSFSLAAADQSRPSVHLCNTSVQGNGSILSMQALLAHLRQEGQLARAADEVKLQRSIETACRLALQAGVEKVVHRDRSFELYGVDLLLDDELHCWLLEVNLSPGFGKHGDVFEALVEHMLDGMHDLVFERQRAREETGTSLQVYGGWRLLESSVHSNNNNRAGSNEEKSEDLEVSRRVDPRAFVGRNGPLWGSEKPDKARLSTAPAAPGVRFLLQGRRVERRHISRLDRAIRSGEALEILATFASNCSQRWPAVRKARRLAQTKIARVWKKYCTQRDYHRSQAALRLQAFSRRWLAIARAARLRTAHHKKCARVVQHWWRRVSRRMRCYRAFRVWNSRVAQSACAAKKVQYAWRKACERIAKRKALAALAIQKIVRGRLGRLAASAHKADATRQELAAETIAWAWFAYLERRRHRLVSQRFADTQRRAHAALRIQAFLRHCRLTTPQTVEVDSPAHHQETISAVRDVEPWTTPQAEDVDSLTASQEHRVTDSSALVVKSSPCASLATVEDSEQKKAARAEERRRARAKRRDQARASSRLAVPRKVRGKHAKGSFALPATKRRGKKSKKKQNDLITSGFVRDDASRPQVLCDARIPDAGHAASDVDEMRAREEELCVRLWRHSMNRPQLPDPLDL